MKNLALTRPLCFCDVETTGTDPATDRIIDICCVRFSPGGKRDSLYRRVKPGEVIPGKLLIPEAATKIHGIRDENVAHLAPFSVFAQEILDFIGEADISGYAVRFDIKFLSAEFSRCHIPFPLAGRSIIDAHAIFSQREPRDLKAAVLRYTGAVHAGAHGAQADAQASAEVLDGQLATYTDLPRTVPELAAAVRGDAVDVDGFFRLVDGAVCFARGKHEGKRLADVARTDRGYCSWLTDKADFFDDVKALVREAVARLDPWEEHRS